MSKSNNSSEPIMDFNTGLWSEEEKVAFERACRQLGWGNWLAFRRFIPSRKTTQIKSHAQKYKRHYPEKVAEMTAAAAQRSRRKRSSPSKKKHTKKKVAARATKNSKAVTPNAKPAPVQAAAAKSTLQGNFPSPMVAVDSSMANKEYESAQEEADNTKMGSIGLSPSKDLEISSLSDSTFEDLAPKVRTKTQESVQEDSNTMDSSSASNEATKEDTSPSKGSEADSDIKELLSADLNWSLLDKEEPSEDTLLNSSTEDTTATIEDLGFDPAIFADICSALLAPPDFNNEREYVVASDGKSRTALDAGALMRARLLSMLEWHVERCWWKGDNKTQKEVAFCVEHWVALAAAMHDDTDWTTIASSDASLGDEILRITHMLASVWERIERSLVRDGYSKLGLCGKERAEALNKIVAIIAERVSSIVSG